VTSGVAVAMPKRRCKGASRGRFCSRDQIARLGNSVIQDTQHDLPAADVIIEDRQRIRDDLQR